MTTTIKIENGDWALADGVVVMVGDYEKCDQDLRENATIAQQSNGTGAGLDDLIGITGDPLGVAIRARTALRRAYEALIVVQRAQAPERTARERVRSIEKVRVSPVAGSVLDFVYEVEVTTYDYARRVAGGTVTSGA